MRRSDRSPSIVLPADPHQRHQPELDLMRIDFLFLITLIEVSLGDLELRQQDNAIRLIL
jgi:hypothetical protein